MTFIIMVIVALSPPSRGAWIEILGEETADHAVVSRPPRGGRGLKFRAVIGDTAQARRPPRGGRGLKSSDTVVSYSDLRRPPRGGRGLKYTWR